MMEAVSDSETSVSFYDTTQRSTPEHSHFQRNMEFNNLLEVLLSAGRLLASQERLCYIETISNLDTVSGHKVTVVYQRIVM